MANEFALIAQILDDRYKEDYATSPYALGAAGINPANVDYSEDEWWEAALKGLALGGSKGFLSQMAKNEARVERQASEDAMIQYMQGDEDQRSLMLSSPERVDALPEFATKLRLAEETAKILNRNRDIGFQGLPVGAEAAAALIKSGAIPDSFTVEELEDLRPSTVSQMTQWHKSQNSPYYDPERRMLISQASARGKPVGTARGELDVEREFGYMPGPISNKIKSSLQSLSKKNVDRISELNFYTDQLYELLDSDLSNERLGRTLATKVVARLGDPNSTVREFEQRATEDFGSGVENLIKRVHGIVDRKGRGFSDEDRRGLREYARVIDAANAKAAQQDVSAAMQGFISTFEEPTVANRYLDNLWAQVPGEYKVLLSFDEGDGGYSLGYAGKGRSALSYGRESGRTPPADMADKPGHRKAYVPGRGWVYVPEKSRGR